MLCGAEVSHKPGVSFAVHHIAGGVTANRLDQESMTGRWSAILVTKTRIVIFFLKSQPNQNEKYEYKTNYNCHSSSRGSERQNQSQ